MAGLTDKMVSLKDFNAIFKDDQLAKEISQLIEKAKKTNKFEIKYSKDELLEIRKSPLCKVSKSAFNARLAKSGLNENIIYSLMKKSGTDKSQNISNSQEDLNGDFFDDNAQQNYNRYKNNVRNVKNRESMDNYRENPMNSRYDREKNYRSNSEAAQCWRTEKNLPNNNGHRTNREYQDRDRYNQPRKYNDRYNNNQRNSYNRNGNGYREDYYEEEPEWFSNGPESMNDFIDLKGFDDDEKCAPADDEHDKSEQPSGKRNSVDLSGRNSGDAHNSSKNESFNRNLSDLTSMLNMDVSNLFNSPNVSFMENKDINDFPLPFSFGDLNASNSSSRADKWFKNKKEAANADESFQNASKTTSPLTVNSDKSGSIMDLFQNVNMRNFPQAPPSNLTGIKVDMSKATSLADLEASLLNSAHTPKNENHGSQNGSAQDSTVLSKLFSLAGQQEANKPSNIQNDPSLHATPNPMAPMGNHFVNEQFGKPLNEPPAVPNNHPPMYPDYSQLANNPMNRMLHPSFFKGNVPMPPFPYPNPEGNLPPFPMDSMHPRQAPPFFGPPIPPEFAHQFAGPNAFLPGFIPNAPYPPHPMMMNPPGAIPPHIAAQLMAHYNAMVQHQQQHQQPAQSPDVAKSKSDESNLADKLLKNSKFTPTAVFRKLKDHDQSKVRSAALKTELQVKCDLDSLAAPGEHLDSNIEQRHLSTADISNARGPNTIPHPLSSYHQPNDKNASDMANLLQQLTMNRSNNQTPSNDLKPNAISLNASDIFSAMTKSDRSAATMDLPPLPMKNALKLEDLEKF